MNMLDAQRRVTKKSLFSEKRLGEKILYISKDGTKEIIALVDVGPELGRPDWNSAHTQVESAAMIDLMEAVILREDVPKPNEGDTIVYHDVRWNVTQMYNYDSAGDNYVLICTKNGKAFGL